MWIDISMAPQILAGIGDKFWNNTANIWNKRIPVDVVMTMSE
jgi:hypothetical protein